MEQKMLCHGNFKEKFAVAKIYWELLELLQAALWELRYCIVKYIFCANQF